MNETIHDIYEAILIHRFLYRTEKDGRVYTYWPADDLWALSGWFNDLLYETANEH